MITEASEALSEKTAPAIETPNIKESPKLLDNVSNSADEIILPDGRRAKINLPNELKEAMS